MANQQPTKQILLTDEEIDRLLEKLSMLRDDPDAQFLAGRIYQQQIHNPSDEPQFILHNHKLTEKELSSSKPLPSAITVIKK